MTSKESSTVSEVITLEAIEIRINEIAKLSSVLKELANATVRKLTGNRPTDGKCEDREVPGSPNERTWDVISLLHGNLRLIQEDIEIISSRLGY